MSCQNCGQDAFLRCTRCKSIQYCSRECQRRDWGVHKLGCEILQGMIAKTIDQDTLDIEVLNPRTDRKLSTHGENTHVVMEMNDHVAKCLQLMKLSSTPIKMQTTKEPGGFGRCFTNVDLMVAKHGGKPIYGWQIFENEFLVEMEAHCVWANTESSFVNVTPIAPQSKQVSNGLFIIDESVGQIGRQQRPIPNRVFWK